MHYTNEYYYNSEKLDFSCECGHKFSTNQYYSVIERFTNHSEDHVHYSKCPSCHNETYRY
jgi:Zn finger protein HypA/HybF involved in hydrogenase expression